MSRGFVGPAIERVVWDWNGTLLDDVEHCVSVINEMLREAGLSELDTATYREVFDFPVRVYYERLGFDLGGGRWERLAARFIAAYDGGVLRCRLQEGAVDVLGALARRGVVSSVLSAARESSVVDLLEHYSIRALFDDVVGLRNHYAEGKEAVAAAWMREAAVDPEVTLLVGDTTHDYEVARSMKMRCILVASGHHSRERLERCGCPVVSSMREVLSQMVSP
jgi:phosphoglycolate phosphatase